MKTARILLMVALAWVTILPLMADDKPAKKAKLSPAAQAMLRMQQFHTALEAIELSEEQQGEVKNLHGELGPKMKEAFEKLGKVFTEEQRTTAEAAAKAAKEAGKEGREFFLAVQSSIEVTKEQEEKLAKVAEEMTAFQREVMKKSMSILTPEQKEQLKAKLASKDGKKVKKDKKDSGSP